MELFIKVIVKSIKYFLQLLNKTIFPVVGKNFIFSKSFIFGRCTPWQGLVPATSQIIFFSKP